MKGEDLTVLEQTTHFYLTSNRGYPHLLIENITSEVKFAERKSAFLQNNKVWKKFCLLFSYKVIPLTRTNMLGTKSDAVSVRAVASHQCWPEFQSHLPHSAKYQKHCLVPRPHYYARPMRLGSRGPRKFLRPRQTRRSETFWALSI